MYCTRKLHGSCSRLRFPAGMSSIEDIQFGSREIEYDPNVSGFPLSHFITWFKSRPKLLTKMWEVFQSYGFSDVVVFGESFGPGIQTKGVKYTSGSEMLFRAFDIMIGENFLTKPFMAASIMNVINVMREKYGKFN